MTTSRGDFQQTLGAAATLPLAQSPHTKQFVFARLRHDSLQPSTYFGASVVDFASSRKRHGGP